MLAAGDNLRLGKIVKTIIDQGADVRPEDFYKLESEVFKDLIVDDEERALLQLAYATVEAKYSGTGDFPVTSQ